MHKHFLFNTKEDQNDEISNILSSEIIPFLFTEKKCYMNFVILNLINLYFCDNLTDL